MLCDISKLAQHVRTLLTVGLQEITDSTNSHVQFIDSRQGHDAEVVRPWPVEGGTLNHQQLFREQQVQDEFLVVQDRAHFWVYAGERI